MAAVSSISIAGGAPPLARGVPGNAAGSGSVDAAAISIAGGGAAPACGGGFVGATTMALWVGCLAHHARLSPFGFVGVGAGLTGSRYRERRRAWWMVVLGVERWRCRLPGCVRVFRLPVPGIVV